MVDLQLKHDIIISVVDIHTTFSEKIEKIEKISKNLLTHDFKWVIIEI